MAVHAFSAFQRGVNIFFVQPDLLCLVTGQTDLVASFFQDQLGQNAVPQVAVLAFFFLNDDMHILHGKVLAFKLGMAIQAFLLDKLAGCAHRRAGTGHNAEKCRQTGAGKRDGKLFDGKRWVTYFHLALWINSFDSWIQLLQLCNRFFEYLYGIIFAELISPSFNTLLDFRTEDLFCDLLFD